MPVKLAFWSIEIGSICVIATLYFIANTHCDKDINRVVFVYVLLADILPILFAIFWIPIAVPAIPNGFHVFKKSHPRAYVAVFILAFFVFLTAKSVVNQYAKAYQAASCGPTQSI